MNIGGGIDGAHAILAAQLMAMESMPDVSRVQLRVPSR
jgi:hypothetical protein